MPGGKSPKIKGRAFEQELVREARARGLDAERAYASNGKSLGEAEEVDLIVNGMRLQAKRRAKLASYLRIGKGVDGVVIREDRGKSYVLIRWDHLLDELAEGGW